MYHVDHADQGGTLRTCMQHQEVRLPSGSPLFSCTADTRACLPVETRMLLVNWEPLVAQSESVGAGALSDQAEDMSAQYINRTNDQSTACYAIPSLSAPAADLTEYPCRQPRLWT